MKIKVYKNDWSVYMEQTGWLYTVLVRDANGEIYDKMRCDDYSDALAYWKSFNAIAKTAK